MDEYVQLKCKSCGATLTPGDSDTVVCPSCGSVQQKLDSKKYLEQAKTEMMAWLSKAIPNGFSTSQTENMDPIARHSIFVNNVKPNVDSEYRDYRFGLMQMLSYPLIALPRRTDNRIMLKHDPKRVFEFDAKVKSVSQLAVDDDGKKLIDESSGVAVAYASLMNNATLLKSDADDRYTFINNNFRQSSDALKTVQGFEPIRERFDALALLSEGIADVNNGRPQIAAIKIEKAKSMLEHVASLIASDIDFAMVSRAAQQEIAIADSMLSIAKGISESPNLDTAAALKVANSIMDEMGREESTASGVWDMQMKRTDRCSDIFRLYGNVMRSKGGERMYRVAAGNGNVYLPMWAVEMKYSFVTGVMFTKKAVEVSEILFVAATFMTSPDCLSDQSLAVTDVFSSIPESTLKERIKGTETSISTGDCTTRIWNDSPVSSLPVNTRCVVPMCTSGEAELLCNQYIDKCRKLHPKLSMGRATVKELIFVPCVLSGDSLTINADLSNIKPKKVGNVKTIDSLAI